MRLSVHPGTWVRIPPSPLETLVNQGFFLFVEKKRHPEKGVFLISLNAILFLTRLEGFGKNSRFFLRRQRLTKLEALQSDLQSGLLEPYGWKACIRQSVQRVRCFVCQPMKAA